MIKQYKTTLSHYRPKTPVAYYVYSTELGKVVLMTTPSGLCGLHLLEEGKSVDYYRALAEKKFEITPHWEKAATQPWWDMLNQQKKPVPLQLKATEFQRQVWEKIHAIPFGAQQTYMQIAQAMSVPKSSRAVGNAVSQNFFFYLIPCHRVVPANGDLGKYRWGTSLKKALLTLEKEQQSKIA